MRLLVVALLACSCGVEPKDPPEGECLPAEEISEPCHGRAAQAACFGPCNAEVDGSYAYNSAVGTIQCVCCPETGICTRHPVATDEEGFAP